MADTLAVLEEHRRALDSELKHARQELRRAKLREKRVANCEVESWRLCGSLLNVALIIYTLAEYVAEPAVRYLLVGWRKRRWPPIEESVLQEMFLQKFLEVDVDLLAGLADLADPDEPHLLREAVAFVEEWKLVEWVRKVNTESGVAPGTDAVLQTMEESRNRVPVNLRPPTKGGSAHAKARIWALRWRRRWGGRHGRIRCREDIDADEMRTKASLHETSLFYAVPELMPHCGPCFGPAVGPLN